MTEEMADVDLALEEIMHCFMDPTNDQAVQQEWVRLYRRLVPVVLRQRAETLEWCERVLCEDNIAHAVWSAEHHIAPAAAELRRQASESSR